MPELLRAADTLGEGTEVICVTSADLHPPRASGRARGSASIPRRSSTSCSRRSARRRWSRSSTATRTRSRSSAAINAVPITPLGVTRFGQSGDLEDVYRHHEIDAETIVGAALDLLG